MDGRQAYVRGDEGRAGMQREGISKALGVRRARDVPDEPSGDTLRREVRLHAIELVGVGIDPAIQQVAGPRELDPLMLTPADPGQLLEPLHHVMSVAQADVCRLGNLLEPPRVLRIDEE